MELIILYGFIVIVYFVPSYVGWKTKYSSGILILNIFLGWTFLGWVAALVWAVSVPKLENTHSKNKNALESISDFIEKTFMVDENEKKERKIKSLSKKLKDGEAIVKYKLNGDYIIITAKRWQEIIDQNKQDYFEIIIEK